MLKAKEIILKKVTGLTSTLGEVTLTGEKIWEQAEAKLRTWKDTVGRGSDDVDFTVIFEDDYRYEGTLELHGSQQATEPLALHIIHFCLAYSGRRLLDGFSAAQSEQFLRTYVSESARAEYGHILDAYQIGEEGEWKTE